MATVNKLYPPNRSALQRSTSSFGQNLSKTVLGASFGCLLGSNHRGAAEGSELSVTACNKEIELLGVTR